MTDAGSSLIRVLVVEDDQQQAALTKGYLDRYSRENDVALAVRWLPSALELAGKKADADLIFLDIGLPGISGMEAAQMLRAEGNRSLIVFVTSLAQYAVTSYQVDALDFMVKPMSYYDFALRMDKALRVIRRTAGRSLFVSTKSGLKVMPFIEIAAIDVMGHNLAYHLTTQDGPLVLRGSLGKVEEQLQGGPFVRISNNCLVNMDHVRSIDGPDVAVSTGETFQISRPRRKEALAAIARYYGGN